MVTFMFINISKWFIFSIFCWWWQNFSHDLSKIFKCTWKILLWSFTNSYGPLPSLHKEGVRVGRFVFFKIDGNGGGSENFCKKRWDKAKWGELSGNGGLPYLLRFFWKFLVMQHRKSRCVYLSFFNKRGVPQNNCLNKIWDHRHL